jgi:acyl carrier protein
MKTTDNALHALIDVCETEGIFPLDDLAPLADDDLFELGLVDSLSLTLLQTVIEETFSVAIPVEVIVGELRTLRDTAAYIRTASGVVAA